MRRTIVIAMIAIAIAGTTTAAHAAGSSTTVLSATTTAQSAVSQAPTPEELNRRINDIDNTLNWILIPITILVGILALGGGLGIVFSIRDQHRISQLHELTVSGELASQRRSDQSFSSFLEGSQTTLTLVNDTLRLAKEATDRAAHTMELKAASNLAGIEEASQQLLLPILDEGVFLKVVADRDTIARVLSLADRLTAIEGYLLLQDIELKPYARFVKGIGQYLEDDTQGALVTLRPATHDATIGELQRFATYWVAHLNSTLGKYDAAMHLFETAIEEDAPEIERYELQHSILEAEFFREADAVASLTPKAKFDMVARVLSRLTTLAAKVYEHDAGDRTSDVSRDVAATRADILAWIAHDPTRVQPTLPTTAIDTARSVLKDVTRGSDHSYNVDDKLTAAWDAAEDDDVARALALLHAETVYPPDFDPRDIHLSFGSVECHFALRMDRNHDPVTEIRRYEDVARMAIERLQLHREQREDVATAALRLVCSARLLELHREGVGEAIRNEETEVKNAYADVHTSLARMKDGGATIFSWLQRRNVDQRELEQEAQAVRDLADQKTTRQSRPRVD